MLVDEAMGAFHKIYGFYPKTVASWLLDTVTVAYLKEKYDVAAVAICRDQTNTDAYTLVGGYFNQAYYPSKYNVFTPAQNAENAIDVPVFRLLGPDPIHNYDSTKYHVNVQAGSCCTLEPVWYTGKTPEVVDWFFETFYQNEDMGFSYSQIGQENSFGQYDDLITPLRMQIEKLKAYQNVQFMTMEEAGRWFKETYHETPVTSVVALSDWNSDKIQSVYYDCKNYMANLFRFGEKVFIRCMYRFDETVPEHYLDTPCTTWDATYENLPLVDTLLWEDDDGILIDDNGAEFDVKREDDEKLTVFWNNCEVTFSPDGVCIKGATPTWNLAGNKAGVRVDGNKILYSYNGNAYAMTVTEGSVKQDGETVTFTGNRIFLEV